MHHRYILLLVCIYLASCATPACSWSFQRSWAVGDGLTGEKYQAILRAAETWCQASDGACCPAIKQTSPRYVQAVGLETLARAGTHYDERRVGLCTHCRPEGQGPLYSCWDSIWILATLDVEQTYETALHEFGHSCGVRHNPDPRSVMHFETDFGKQQILTSDLGAL